jgi:hypothetical protein
MSGGGDTTTVQKSEPWAEQKPYLRYGFEQARDIYNQPGPLYYPGQTVADFAPEQLQAQAGTVARATDGSPLNAAAGHYLQNLLAGRYLEAGNPYLGAVAGQARAGVDSTYAAAGRYGSGAHDAAVTQALAPLYYQDYASQLARMDQAAQLAPALANQDYVDLNALAQVGQQRQSQAQALVNEDVNRYNYYANLPANKLNRYMNQIQGNYGGTVTTTQPYQGPSIGQQILGGLFDLGGAAVGAPWFGRFLGMP